MVAPQKDTFELDEHIRAEKRMIYYAKDLWSHLYGEAICIISAISTFKRWDGKFLCPETEQTLAYIEARERRMYWNEYPFIWMKWSKYAWLKKRALKWDIPAIFLVNTIHDNEYLWVDLRVTECEPCERIIVQGSHHVVWREERKKQVVADIFLSNFCRI